METEADVLAKKKDLYTLDMFAEPIGETHQSAPLNRANLGTFQESLRSPVHRWFTYPAGFSYRAVEEAFRSYEIGPCMVVYDPFAGTGTTNIVAKQKGVHSFGVEAHPFVQFVAQTKLFWEFDFPQLLCSIEALAAEVHDAIEARTSADIPVVSLFPELVCKCYSEEKLAKLYLCREAVLAITQTPFRNFAKLALTNLLRATSDVAAGWPYIAPKKAKTNSATSHQVDIAKLFLEQMYMMYGDLQQITRSACSPGTATLIAGDSRQYHPQIADASVDIAFTSPRTLTTTIMRIVPVWKPTSGVRLKHGAILHAMCAVA